MGIYPRLKDQCPALVGAVSSMYNSGLLSGLGKLSQAGQGQNNEKGKLVKSVLRILFYWIWVKNMLNISCKNTSNNQSFLN